MKQGFCHSFEFADYLFRKSKNGKQVYVSLCKKSGSFFCPIQQFQKENRLTHSSVTKKLF